MSATLARCSDAVHTMMSKRAPQNPGRRKTLAKHGAHFHPERILGRRPSLKVEKVVSHDRRERLLGRRHVD